MFLPDNDNYWLFFCALSFALLFNKGFSLKEQKISSFKAFVFTMAETLESGI
jgi:hypothetical protein